MVLLTVGKTNQQYLRTGISEYKNRLKHYTDLQIIEIPNLKAAKNLSRGEIIEKEGKLILKQVNSSDYLILLDEKGRGFTSIVFAKRLQSWILSRKKKLIFVIGGAYGFSHGVHERSDEKLSLSKMTFSHQIVRLFFIEQLYRAFTILNNEPYHNN